MIRLKSNGDKIAKSLATRLGKQINARVHKILPQLGDIVISEIKKRTLAGVDKDGKPFPDYSPEYKKIKHNKPGGIKAIGGSLLNRMVTRKVGNKAIIIEFSGPGAGNLSASRLAAIHQTGQGKMPRRAFFGMKPGSSEERRIINAAKKLFGQKFSLK
ncbi:MAG: hypothetical protein MI702_13925 [Chlorobiales bacterium]|nr:hypothetical protein [Chlorobiales bacterium]